MIMYDPDHHKLRSLLDLPTDLLLYICLHLDALCILRIEQTCKTLASISRGNQGTIWRSLLEDLWGRSTAANVGVNLRGQQWRDLFREWHLWGIQLSAAANQRAKGGRLLIPAELPSYERGNRTISYLAAVPAAGPAVGLTCQLVGDAKVCISSPMVSIVDLSGETKEQGWERNSIINEPLKEIKAKWIDAPSPATDTRDSLVTINEWEGQWEGGWTSVWNVETTSERQPRLLTRFRSMSTAHVAMRYNNLQASCTAWWVQPDPSTIGMSTSDDRAEIRLWRLPPSPELKPELLWCNQLDRKARARSLALSSLYLACLVEDGSGYHIQLFDVSNGALLARIGEATILREGGQTLFVTSPSSLLIGTPFDDTTGIQSIHLLPSGTLVVQAAGMVHIYSIIPIHPDSTHAKVVVGLITRVNIGDVTPLQIVLRTSHDPILVVRDFQSPDRVCIIRPAYIEKKWFVSRRSSGEIGMWVVHEKESAALGVLWKAVYY
ncbi:hypothetical protein SpCBS45565_g04411 [Spizellomyces sp. 'palustris']|nr:hypothetical protein SpCBS45565_g04411 [Spizellomyces sp. 'palustris']